MRSQPRSVLGVAVLIVMMAVTLIPFVSLLLTALQPKGTIPVGLSWPQDPQWGNFAEAFETSHFLTLLGSSSLIVLGVVPAALLFSTMAGFALGNLRVPGGTAVYLLLIGGLTIPFESAIIPLYYQSRDLGLLNTQWAVILPLIGLSVPFGVFWMRGHFRAIPAELTEAARLDGATAWQQFRHVHLPLAVPALVTLGLLQFLAAWNQFLLAIVLIDDPDKRTMAGALGAFQGEHRTEVVLLCAGALLVMAPTIVVFLVLQRHFIKALLAGAVKG